MLGRNRSEVLEYSGEPGGRGLTRPRPTSPAAAYRPSSSIAASAARHAALRAHYEENFDTWFDIASGWENTNSCGASYHGIDIAFMPIFNWIRL
jgi:hypothetical protein